MDPRERYSDPQEALRTAMDGHQAQQWTALPGIVQSFNAAAATVTVQPAIQGQVRLQDGTWKNVNLPLLPDVPVVFPHGGGVTLTFAIAAGDEVLVVFASRCIDGWWQDGGVQPPLDKRMHDMSDGFAIPGPFSQKRRIGNISTNSAQLRSNDGGTVVELASGRVRIKAASVTVDTPQANFTGKIVANGDIVGGGISLMTHRHGGVQSGVATTDVPVATSAPPVGPGTV